MHGISSYLSLSVEVEASWCWGIGGWKEVEAALVQRAET